jgi:signal transduction histidine kinase
MSFLPSISLNFKPQAVRQALRTAVLQNQFGLIQHQSEQPFKLLRYFSLTSLSAFLIATGLLSAFYRSQAINDLVATTEEKNVTITQVLANTLWAEYGSFLSTTQQLDAEALRNHSLMQDLQASVFQQLEGLSVVKIKIFDLQGRVVFSSDPDQIGQDSSKSNGFRTAKSGKMVSKLDHKETFQALRYEIKDRHLFSSYIPLRAGGDENQPVEAVFELYTDVTPLLQNIDHTQRNIVLGSIVILALLYGALYLVMKRADTLIKRQHQSLQQSKALYQNQAETLERTISQLKKTQAQAVQNEKMSSLGQLVAGVAHEINNPIGFIYGNITYAEEYFHNLLKLLRYYQAFYPEPNSEIQTWTEEIDLDYLLTDLPKVLNSMKVGSDRVKQIVSSLRNFSRMDEAELKPVDIHEGIESTLVILNHRLKAQPSHPKIDVVRTYGALPIVTCFANQLNQVFMNLLSNAIDALECQSVPAPQITIQTEATTTHVLIHISDNGSGIPESIKQRLFDPFFTTKPVGKGTGLGLSISYQIISESHHGQLWCESTPGTGSRFSIEIPIQQNIIASDGCIRSLARHFARST